MSAPLPSPDPVPSLAPCTLLSLPRRGRGTAVTTLVVTFAILTPVDQVGFVCLQVPSWGGGTSLHAPKVLFWNIHMHISRSSLKVLLPPGVTVASRVYHPLGAACLHHLRPPPPPFCPAALRLLTRARVAFVRAPRRLRWWAGWSRQGLTLAPRTAQGCCQ